MSSNRLAGESSPYLRQHEDNPVNWYPWGEEALAEARRLDKPILLSVGYSACHWCHVMAHESFESDEIASRMNELFVNVKVDREERPDIDAIYMSYVQMTTGQGGWPLTVFLTPDLVPFYGGTYFPPDDRMGRPGFGRVLAGVADFYRNRAADVARSREEIAGRLAEVNDAGRWEGGAEPGPDLLDTAFYAHLQQLDNRYGGFGGAPKFPSAMGLGFLMRYARRRDAPAALEAVTLTLDRMADGGIYDQLGGGFHRYSVDDEWLAPHFEKMLYDNALLAGAYLEAFQLTGRERYRDVARETLAYVLRDLRDPVGGFYAAEDADSEGEEGRFYCWTLTEVKSLLGPELAPVFTERYDVRTAGNWEGKTILRRVVSTEDLAARHGARPDEVAALLEQGRARLLEARDARVRPALDSKVLAAWNGLMLRTVAEAAFVLDDADLRQAALDCASFLATEMISDGRVWRSWQDGEAKLAGYLEDYTHVAAGFLACYQLTADAQWLELAAVLTESQIRWFADEQAASFYFTAADHEELLVRPRDFFDNATPNGNSQAARNLLLLAELTGDESYRTRAEKLLASVTAALERYALGFGNWLQALDFLIGPVQQIAIVGDDCDELLRPVRDRFLPNKVLARSPDGASQLPLLKDKMVLEGRPTAYLCQHYACRQPTADPAELARQLDQDSPAGG